MKLYDATFKISEFRKDVVELKNSVKMNNESLLNKDSNDELIEQINKLEYQLQMLRESL